MSEKPSITEIEDRIHQRNGARYPTVEDYNLDCADLIARLALAEAVCEAAVWAQEDIQASGLKGLSADQALTKTLAAWRGPVMSKMEGRDDPT